MKRGDIVKCVKKPGNLNWALPGREYVVNAVERHPGGEYIVIIGEDRRVHTVLSHIFLLADRPEDRVKYSGHHGGLREGGRSSTECFCTVRQDARSGRFEVSSCAVVYGDADMPSHSVRIFAGGTE